MVANWLGAPLSAAMANQGGYQAINIHDPWYLCWLESLKYSNWNLKRYPNFSWNVHEKCSWKCMKMLYPPWPWSKWKGSTMVKNRAKIPIKTGKKAEGKECPKDWCQNPKRELDKGNSNKYPPKEQGNPKKGKRGWSQNGKRGWSQNEKRGWSQNGKMGGRE